MTHRDKSIIKDLIAAECELSNPVFTWNGVSYPCLSSDPIETDLFGEGGDTKQLSVNMTVRKLNCDSTSLFTNNQYPQVNDTFLHNGYSFRVATFSPGVLGLTFNLTGISDSQGN